MIHRYESIQTVNGDITNETHGIIVHGVSAQGKMGTGVAKAIRDKYPVAYEDYMRMYRLTSNSGGLKLGQWVYSKINERFYIVSAVTQMYYGRNPDYIYADYGAIQHVFRDLNDFALDEKLPLKFPKIGCGHANGDWNVVEKIINESVSVHVEKILFVYP